MMNRMLIYSNINNDTYIIERHANNRIEQLIAGDNKGMGEMLNKWHIALRLLEVHNDWDKVNSLIQKIENGFENCEDYELNIIK